MNKHAIVVAGLCLCILPATQAQAESSDYARAPTITITKLDVTNKTLEVSYQIRNDSEQDIWLCEFISKARVFERYLAEDGQTLLLRRRLNVPMNATPLAQPIGRYLRLRSGHSRMESLTLPLPVGYSSHFAGLKILPDVVDATRLVIEIGYYVGDLPERIFTVLDQAEDKDTVPYVRPARSTGTPLRVWLGGSLFFNQRNERLKDRDEAVIIPWMDQTLEGEQVLRIAVNDLHIPYQWQPQPPKYSSFDLPSCTEAKIHYQPSALEYFLPYAQQQSLLSPTEMQYLRSLENIEVRNPADLSAFSNEVSEGVTDGIAVAEGRLAHVVCYRDTERLASFTIYDDSFIETEDKQRLRYYKGLQGLKRLTPQILPFESRVSCAANLKNLWYRLRLYHKAEKVRLKQPLGGSNVQYPAPAEWCDAMIRAYVSSGMYDESFMKTFACPGAGDGKNHYAMNPDYKLESPADMVLLFETKAGWNQHGGAELFTFDNHDPKGGCVLLNNGTVKFIRTKEELQQLRWK